MHRSAPRLTRILACAAVPVMLVVAGCSSDSDGETPGKGAAESSAGSSKTPKDATPTVAPAKFAKLPEACKAITAKTVDALVPKAKTKTGTAGKSTDLSSRSSCSWNGLVDKGLKGSEYRWLDVSFLRYESNPTLGSGEERATENMAKEVAKLKATEGAKGVRESPANGVGDATTAVSYQLRKTSTDFVYATTVARTGNVMIVINYNGAGYAGAEKPVAQKLMDSAVLATKDAVAAVAAANK
ncbi:MULTISPECIES: DUF3558 family protein [Streptomyces]|uniref:DUF3558 family protein n=1 Tax=Streptomyces solicathayae TaxID=3081768 RepID=A0ABZ0LTN2_9ACTN|nr:DUF3558 family protein [Streptomyces sp. HUAS YS2]WOX22854.1 DUF3558 family protein [Streptomyces sp. HUAS YS2]